MEELRKFYNNFQIESFRKNEVIFIEGIEPSCAYAVKSGVVRLHTDTENNEERINSFAAQDELIPISWLFDKTPMTLFCYTAHTDCQLFKIQKDVFRSMIVNNSELTSILLEHVVNDYVIKSLQIRALEQPRVFTKLLLTLDSLSLRYGNKILSDMVRINIPLTQRDLAALTGASRETVATELSKLKKDDIITCRRKLYTVNVVKLRKLIEYEGSPSVTIQP